MAPPGTPTVATSGLRDGDSRRIKAVTHGGGRRPAPVAQQWRHGNAGSRPARAGTAKGLRAGGRCSPSAFLREFDPTGLARPGIWWRLPSVRRRS